MGGRQVRGGGQLPYCCRPEKMGKGLAGTEGTRREGKGLRAAGQRLQDWEGSVVEGRKQVSDPGGNRVPG